MINLVHYNSENAFPTCQTVKSGEKTVLGVPLYLLVRGSFAETEGVLLRWHDMLAMEQPPPLHHRRRIRGSSKLSNRPGF